MTDTVSHIDSQSMTDLAADPRVSRALEEHRSIIIVGRATIAAKLASFKALLHALPKHGNVGIIEDGDKLEDVPESAIVIDAHLKGVDTIHRIIRDDELSTIAYPSMHRGDIVRLLMDVSGQENGQVLMINGAVSDATQTLTTDLPMILLKSSPSGHTEFSDAAIKAMNPVVVELNAEDAIRAVTEVDLQAQGLRTIDVK